VTSRVAFFHATGILLCGGLLITGPLLCVYKGANSFTNHSAFQESYRLGPADQFYVSQFMPLRFPLNRNTAPPFYRELATRAEIKTVLEYPMVLGDHLNLLYFYQQIHAKRVKIGYFPKPQMSSSALENENRFEGEMRIRRPFVWGDNTPDDVFGEVPNRGKIRFQNRIDLTDIACVHASGADLVILHKDLVSEWSARHTKSGTNSVVPLVAKNCLDLFGPPEFEDDQLIVYDIKAGWQSSEKSKP
jgi:hypothetical protein